MQVIFVKLFVLTVEKVSPRITKGAGVCVEYNNNNNINYYHSNKDEDEPFL